MKTISLIPSGDDVCHSFNLHYLLLFTMSNLHPFHSFINRAAVYTVLVLRTLWTKICFWLNSVHSLSVELISMKTSWTEEKAKERCVGRYHKISDHTGC